MKRTTLHHRLFAIAGPCAVLALTLAVCGPAAAQKERLDSAAKVKVMANADGDTINVKIDIEKGWHIYANPVGDELFEANATKVVIKSGGKVVPAKIIYPKGKAKELGDIKYNVYVSTVTIQAVLEPRAEDAVMEVTVQVNSCNDAGVCLRPGEKTVPVR